MAISLVSVEPRSATRLRLLFSNTLAVGAFATSKYAVTPTDSVGVTPTVAAAIVVSVSAESVELALDTELTRGAKYTLTCTAVPAQDASTFTGTQTFRFVDGRTLTDQERAKTDTQVALYGRDLVFNGVDVGEAIDGDLDAIEGQPNAEAAIFRRVYASGLPIDRNYGVYADEYVDAPAQEATTLHGAIVRQVMADDRAESVECTFQQEDNGEVFFRIAPKLRGSNVAQAFRLKVSV